MTCKNIIIFLKTHFPIYAREFGGLGNTQLKRKLVDDRIFFSIMWKHIYYELENKTGLIMIDIDPSNV